MADELTPAPVDDLITPKAGAAAPVAEEDAPDVTLPPELLRIPAMQALMTGKPGAASVNFRADKNLAVAKEVFKHKDHLLSAGFGLYRATDGDTGVLFNQLYLHPEEIKRADADGTLLDIAPPLRDLNSKIANAGHADHPILSHDGVVPQGMKVAPVPNVPQSQPAVAPAGSAALRKALTAKIAGLSPGAPTTGPQPGAGRLVNSLGSPVV
jgi:hypothetical protein